MVCSLFLSLTPGGPCHPLSHSPGFWALFAPFFAPGCPTFPHIGPPSRSLHSGRALAHFGFAWCLLVHEAASLLLESANHSFQCQPANWFILPPTRLSLPCRNEAISSQRRLPVRAAAGIINEDKVPAAETISPTAPPAAASFIIRLSCRRELLNPDPCIRGLY